MLPGGDLVTLNGHPVLDISGSPLTLDPRSPAVEISRDGMIRQNGRAVGALGLFNVDFSGGYARYENSAFLPRTPAQPAEESAGRGFIQGFVEESNVNAVLAMTQLINVQRIFEAVSAGMEQRDSTLRDTIQALGARGS
ncbi:flagellar basal body rod C-terminal domain-containing protein [Aestuariivirga sp.]|uniref:flagellar basal body rod C-terminal domain-containing protein n=1 Tax=Aestuariivirga sp. TaxID=2650926 RepID=UPI00359391F4